MGERLSKALRSSVPAADVVLLLAEYSLREHGAGRGRLGDVLVVDADMARLVADLGLEKVVPLVGMVAGEGDEDPPAGLARLPLAPEPHAFSTACAWVAGAVAAITGLGLDGRSRQEYERRYEDLVNALPDIVYQLDVDGTIEFVNESVASLGYSPAELIGKHFSVLLYDDDAAAVDRDKVLPDYAGYKTGLALSPKLFNERRSVDRRTADLEVRLRKKPGGAPGAKDFIGSVISYGEVSAAGEYGRGKGEGFVGSVGIIRDVTLRRKAEETLRKLYQAIDQLGTCVFILNHEFEVEYVNPAFFMLGGFSPGEVIGQNLFRFLAFPPDRCQAIERTVFEGFEVREEAPVPRSKGGEFWAGIHLAPVRSPSGAIVHALAIVDDISASRAMEDSLRRAKAELEAADRDKARFMAKATRELLKPLESLSAAASRLDPGVPGIGSLVADAAILADVIGSMLDFVRSGTVEPASRPKPFRLGSFVAKRCAPYGRRAKALGLGFRAEIGVDGQAECDPDRLGRVIGLLLDDSLARLEEGGLSLKATLDTKPGNVPHVIVEVGMEGREAEAESGSKSESLALARDIAKAMGGELRAPEREGPVTLIIPASAPVAASAPIAASAHAPRYSVLVVDDNEINLEYVRTLLENSGFRVLAANGADEAIKALETSYVDAALIDLRMPGVSGAELAGMIRGYKGARYAAGMPLFAMTAYDSEVSEDDCRAFRKVFPKPADLRSVTDSINQAMAELDSPRAPVREAAGRGPGADKPSEAAAAAVEALAKALSGGSAQPVDVKAEAAALELAFRRRGEPRGQELVRQFVEHYADEDREVLSGLVERIGKLAAASADPEAQAGPGPGR